MKYLIILITFSLLFGALGTASGEGISHHLPPMKQINDGVKPTNVTCTEGLQLVLKLSNGNPACVRLSSVAVLIERGWAIHVLPDVAPDSLQNSDLSESGQYDVEASSIDYADYSGYLAKPSTGESYPGIILIHEWWGLNDNIKETAENLASHGYVVLAVDLFDGSVATDTQTAMAQVSSLDQEKAISNMNSATEYLKSENDSSLVGSIGWCFGGAQSLNLALNNPDIDATVIYYGKLVTDADTLSALPAPVLGIFGELDQGIPVSTVNQFEDTLDELSIANEIIIYPGVDHAFANPTGARYAPTEADDAWQKTLDFLEANLKL